MGISLGPKELQLQFQKNKQTVTDRAKAIAPALGNTALMFTYNMVAVTAATVRFGLHGVSSLRDVAVEVVRHDYEDSAEPIEFLNDK